MDVFFSLNTIVPWNQKQKYELYVIVYTCRRVDMYIQLQSFGKNLYEYSKTKKSV